MSEKRIIVNPLRSIGAATFGMLATLGQLTLFMINAVSHFVRPPIYFRLIGRQMIDVGYYAAGCRVDNPLFGHGDRLAELYRCDPRHCGCRA